MMDSLTFKVVMKEEALPISCEGEVMISAIKEVKRGFVFPVGSWSEIPLNL
jgi:hypothetical protein